MAIRPAPARARPRYGDLCRRGAGRDAAALPGDHPASNASDRRFPGYPLASGATLGDGDADGDGDVDGVDFGIWQAAYVPPASEVPEPATLAVLALGGLAGLVRRRW